MKRIKGTDHVSPCGKLWLEVSHGHTCLDGMITMAGSKKSLKWPNAWKVLSQLVPCVFFESGKVYCDQDRV